MSVHLVGGGWTPGGDPEVTSAFLAEAAARAAGSGRMVPRIGVLIVVDDDTPSLEYRTGYPESLRAVAACDPVVSVIASGEAFAPQVLTDIDALVVGGGLTPAYHAAIDPLVEEIRLLVADGLPYLGFSAGAMIAADRAIVGGWRINGIAVCPEETGEDLDEVAVVEGLGLVDLAVDVHAAQWGTLSRLVAATEAGLVDGGVAIDEKTVLVVGDDGFAVFGAGSVWQVLDEPAGVIVGTLGA
ncbi:Type 1 glutamine amidotransferase-like domain-containing protein [Protaetiibacter mangrovi]|uniref:Type 1 glutamine amidotransferase-like domain-containing protein n=1 Tax=Protaetiibacter mangrovi TaxID=2970926 RepID=A0ABT1ZIZ1_9MICO|nr:Type 1 glutamine amidotransferase-like domain-containing protein [Protaetiibacter mangrovi]MCS0500652.1 Type 1 glutamine amidotransferase-like domain-containing protein [Protaetiibacter mangrovi]